MGPWQRCPSPPPPNSSDAGRWVRAGCGAVSVAIPLAMLLAGTAGNALAMALVSRAYRARAARRRRSFLLCIGSLALTDLLGQLLTAPIVIAVYLSGGAWEALDPSGRLCAFFGGSMTAFGLCPLLTASAMAAERALAARAPHWYASRVSARAARRALLAIWAAALGLALLPLAGVGRYTLQWPGTWCFIAIGTAAGTGNNAFPAAFALLGLGALLVTAACNLATIEALLARCRHRAGPRWGRVTMESLAQLLGIMCVLAACWAPLLITMLKMSWGHTFEHCRVVPTPAPGSEPPGECSFFLTAVRLASLNQILDPWVYLLLRKILLQRFCQAASAVSKCSNTECKQRSITLSEEIRRTAV